ncbi:MAG: hypothetical protein ABW061_01815 [Polyangiaceae bacterium]
MYSNTRFWFTGYCLAALSWSALSGCTLQKNDDAGEFREAVPESQAVAVSGPDGNGSSSTASEGPSRRTLAAGASTPYAKWYGFTREMRDGVNSITGAVLGGVWLVVQTTPSQVSADSATWGPWEDQLAPASYRVRVTRVATDEYDYVLEGHAKASTVDTDYRAVLSGHGYGKLHEKHGQGSFTIDLDVAKALDPFKHQNDSGKVTVDHALPRDFSENFGALPRTITAAVLPAGEANYTVESAAKADHTGTIHVTAHVDIDDAKNTALEDVVIDSRWAASGAGQADIEIAGGDVPASISMVHALECWGTDFTQSYYKDSAGFAETQGDVSACVYGER